MYQGSLGAASNRATFEFAVTDLTDLETGDAIDLTDATDILFEVRDPRDGSVVVSKSLGDGIELEGTDAFVITVPKSEMLNLCPGTYEFGCTLDIDDVTLQIAVGTLPVVDGVVSR